MTRKLGIVMDPIHTIHIKKDSTLAMLWEAAARGFEIYYFTLNDLFLKDGIPYGDARILKVFHDEKKFYELGETKRIALSLLDVILMRKDPPFNEDYIYSTYILEHAENLGVLVVNKPQSLRDANEKLYATYFPECTPENIVTRSVKHLHEFWQTHQDIVCKPLNSMGGVSVFRVQPHDVNANVIFDILTHGGNSFIMAQKFIPEITAGDKRILLINGDAIPHAIARIPQGEDWRGNLAVGAKAVIQPLSARDQFICDRLGPVLRARGLYFVGIDVIGDYLTEINVTSPTGIRELDNALKMNVSAQFFDFISSAIKSSH